MQLFKDKFEVILVSIVFIIVFSVWIQSDYRADVKEFLIAIFGAWLALLRVVQKPSNIQTDTIQADNIETARTQTGDIIGRPAAKAIKENQE